MSTAGDFTILIVLFLIVCYFAGTALLAKRRMPLGFLLPALSLLFAVWN